WIREQKYKDPAFGDWTRPSWGDYAQDSISVFEQKTIEGHAVRATLLATGITAVALENNSPEYVQTIKQLWDNMTGKRMCITGGVGAGFGEEKFGPDYFLPTDSYLETCAAVGAGFFSQRMNELTADAKYMDEFERALYNNVLTGISLSGDKYTYQNPLNAHHHSRWDWHPCPCCPPMFLKIVSAVPGYIYASQADNLYINLFIGSRTTISLNGNPVQISQETEYPWKGNIKVNIHPEKETRFTVKIRIPGWAQGKENPFDLYMSNLKPQIKLTVNGIVQNLKLENGYATIKRKWKKGDLLELSLPMQPRIITANEHVKELKEMVTLASGPLIYCFESIDNKDLDNLKLNTASQFDLVYQKDLLNGVNVITGMAKDNDVDVPVTAIPYYVVGNRGDAGYKTWLLK
ncbi:MAG: glycoside hydrolase family 127 protein, partial [Tannerella sp.]|nr:glycoside hydrolase family 127 protein [Tannerella sp.]